MPLLVVEGLEVWYGQAIALGGLSLEVRTGEFLSIVGANGAGKTTLIRTIAGMIRSRTGTIRYRDRVITGLSNAEVCELGIAQVPEGRQVFPSLSVAENLWLGGALRRARRNRKANLERIYELFPRLRDRQVQPAGTLSGGEQQMLAIGRCLMAEPELIMFDEPSLGLSPQMTQLMFATVRALNQQGVTVLLVEQNVADSLDLCDRAYVIETGHITLEGTGAALLHDERVRAAYLGL
jgi:branched-chain amino acid transport system ATP-binding protein